MDDIKLNKDYINQNLTSLKNEEIITNMVGIIILILEKYIHFYYLEKKKKEIGLHILKEQKIRKKRFC